MNDRLISWIRTAVPYGWSLLIAWAVAHGLPDALVGWASGLGGYVTDFAVAGVVYALARWVEPHLPAWLTVVIFGSRRTPTYAPVGADSVHTITSLRD